VSAALPLDARAIQRGRAGLVSRSAAGAIDLAVVTVGVFAAVAAASVWRFFFGGIGVLRLVWPSQIGLASLGGALLVAYLTWGWARIGRTMGKRILGLALVRTSGDRVGWIAAFVRAALCVVFPLGLLWCGVSRENRSLQDLIVGTAVVYDWHGARYRW
jgi:uncharacterized RDD family membrane protein YckC